jgi:hypothetical protein
MTITHACALIGSISISAKSKDHSRILDTINLPIISICWWPKIQQQDRQWSGANACGPKDASEGEIVVILADSDPPSLLRLWRAFAEGRWEPLMD